MEELLYELNFTDATLNRVRDDSLSGRHRFSTREARAFEGSMESWVGSIFLFAAFYQAFPQVFLRTSSRKSHKRLDHELGGPDCSVGLTLCVARCISF